MKKLFGIMALAAIAAAAGCNFSQSQNEVELSDLALANVEALARNETLSGSHYIIVVYPGPNAEAQRRCDDGGQSFCF